MFTVCATCNVILPVEAVLYFYFNTFRSMCSVSNMAVFCCSFISCFPGMLHRFIIIIISSSSSGGGSSSSSSKVVVVVVVVVKW